MHWLVNRILSNEIHRPSAAKLWQIPASEVFPRLPAFPLLCTPLEVQATSYFAASVKIFNFSCMLKFSCISISITAGENVCSFFLYSITHDPLSQSMQEHLFENKAFPAFSALVSAFIKREIIRKIRVCLLFLKLRCKKREIGQKKKQDRQEVVFSCLPCGEGESLFCAHFRRDDVMRADGMRTNHLTAQNTSRRTQISSYPAPHRYSQPLPRPVSRSGPSCPGCGRRGW